MVMLTADERDDLQAFLKDWLRHCGRTQADLRRALRAASIRMPVLVQELERIHASGGLPSLAERLCEIETLWQNEDDDSDETPENVQDSFSQLDMLLQEIRASGPSQP
ncbi:MAG: hypothetical protein ACKOCM_08725 [Cyanobacteriota bacterium]